jgi:hypothetical protein
MRVGRSVLSFEFGQSRESGARAVRSAVARGVVLGSWKQTPTRGPTWGRMGKNGLARAWQGPGWAWHGPENGPAWHAYKLQGRRASRVAHAACSRLLSTKPAVTSACAVLLRYGFRWPAWDVGSVAAAAALLAAGQQTQQRKQQNLLRLCAVWRAGFFAAPPAAYITSTSRPCIAT